MEAHSKETRPNRVKTMKEKLDLCSPYNLFFTSISVLPETLTNINSISFPDLICPSIGKLVRSLHLSFMVDLDWLIEQYRVHNLQETPMTILHGMDQYSIDNEEKKFSNVAILGIHQEVGGHGFHHTKLSILQFEDDTIRVIIYTANLYEVDWNRYNNGLWISPPLPKMPKNAMSIHCAGPTGFKHDLFAYLKSYRIDLLDYWVDTVKRSDFSSVKVHFVCSTPGVHKNGDGNHFYRVSELLSKYCSLPNNGDGDNPASWSIIAQASSIGAFGTSVEQWLEPVLLRALSYHRKSKAHPELEATLKIVYPTMDDVWKGYFCPLLGICLPYEKCVHEKQRWLNKYLHVWKSDKLGRTAAMPHIKSYARISPCNKKIAWCLLTSGNISKSAWGRPKYRNNFLFYNKSYEVGVLFLPHMFNEDYFSVQREAGDDGGLFPLIFDLPLVPYQKDDEPFYDDINPDGYATD